MAAQVGRQYAGDFRQPLKLRIPHAAVERIAMDEEQRETFTGV
jgi:hypothetical protein